MICMVLEWTLGLKRLAYSPGSILVSAAASVYISREHGRLRTTAPDILCESCACIIHTNLQSCMFIIRNTPRSSHVKREPQRFQATSYWVPEDQGTGVSV